MPELLKDLNVPEGYYERIEGVINKAIEVSNKDKKFSSGLLHISKNLKGNEAILAAFGFGKKVGRANTMGTLFGCSSGYIM